jgi:hypothetical protein
VRGSVRAARVHRVAVALSRVLDRRPLRAGVRPAVFVHVPRASGTSIIGDLGFERLSRPGDVVHFFDGRARRVTFDHVPPHVLIEARMVDPGFFERAWVFTMVRDPYTWAASMHATMREHGTIDATTGFVEWLEGIARVHERLRAAFPSPAVLAPPEADWLSRRFRNSLNLTWMMRAWPQHVWLDGIRVDHIGRLEARDATIRTVCEETGIPMPNSTHRYPSTGPTAGERYDAEPGAAALVRELYAEDFRRFDYDPGRVPSARDPDRRDGHG